MGSAGPGFGPLRRARSPAVRGVLRSYDCQRGAEGGLCLFPRIADVAMLSVPDSSGGTCSTQELQASSLLGELLRHAKLVIPESSHESLAQISLALSPGCRSCGYFDGGGNCDSVALHSFIRTFSRPPIPSYPTEGERDRERINWRMNFPPNEQGATFKINLYDHGSGVAVGDFDGDGLDDIYFCNQLGPSSLYHNKW